MNMKTLRATATGKNQNYCQWPMVWALPVPFVISYCFLQLLVAPLPETES